MCNHQLGPIRESKKVTHQEAIDVSMRGGRRSRVSCVMIFLIDLVRNSRGE